MFWFDKKIKSPFIYIAAMPRSGSTYLAGMLTQEPESFIISEPGYARGIYHNLEQFRSMSELKIGDLEKFQNNPRQMVRTFAKKLYPRLTSTYRVVGVKECFHDHWWLYEKYFENIKYVVIARDPRDIMISTLEYGEKKAWHKKLWADQSDDYIAGRFNESWAFMKQIIDTRKTLNIRYEDFCKQKMTMQEILDFCELDIGESIDACRKIEEHARGWEIERHGQGISNKTVNRWKDEKDAVIVQRATSVAEKMKDYCDYWGYPY